MFMGTDVRRSYQFFAHYTRAFN